MHYIQDYVIDPTEKFLIFSFRSSKAHDNLEKSLKNIPIDYRTIYNGAMLKKPNNFKDRLFSAKRYRDPTDALREATFLTASAIAVVLDPEREGRNFSKALMIHLILVISPILIIALYDLSLILLGLIISYILHKLDQPFHKANLERIWFKKMT